MYVHLYESADNDRNNVVESQEPNVEEVVPAENGEDNISFEPNFNLLSTQTEGHCNPRQSPKGTGC